MIRAILFDLGNTLISYYQKDEFPEILSRAINDCCDFLIKSDIHFKENNLWFRVEKQDYESSNYEVRPLEERLQYIFNINNENILEKLSRIFMKQIFERGKTYDDVEPTLRKIQIDGLKTAIISNTPWGSPSFLWREELKRHNLDSLIALSIFCRDVGWRKPDARIFIYALKKLLLEPDECLFVGDDPRWDIVGSSQVGIRSILIDRTKKNPQAIYSLNQIFNHIN
ncbi:HAD family hydrolase [Candidatus Bathyarchaeota archaeon]|nr:HAD family hydrolase [Candidatus Bathyarchaeota archaeon]